MGVFDRAGDDRDERARPRAAAAARLHGLSASVCPPTNSMHRYACPPPVPTSWTVTMFGCLSRRRPRPRCGTGRGPHRSRGALRGPSSARRRGRGSSAAPCRRRPCRRGRVLRAARSRRSRAAVQSRRPTRARRLRVTAEAVPLTQASLWVACRTRARAPDGRTEQPPTAREARPPGRGDREPPHRRPLHDRQRTSAARRSIRECQTLVAVGGHGGGGAEANAAGIAARRIVPARRSLRGSSCLARSPAIARSDRARPS